MTIQDALERAKQLRKTRERNPAAGAERSHVPLDDTGSLAIVRERIPVEASVAVPQEKYRELERVDMDLDDCGRRRVLLTDAQILMAGRAGAAYRLLRSRVLHRARTGNWSIVGVTSAEPGDGKTLTAVNLAISIAREKQRVVYLLDLDMRNPSVCETLGARPPKALSEFFSADLAAEEVLFETAVENLVIAGNTEAVPNASELLASPRLEALLKYIRRRSPGALILIDLPPALSTDEALVVAPRVDAMFLVVSEGKTRREAAMRAVNLLGDFKIAGIIVNRSREEVGGDYYTY
ncbi:MAG: CpsD/CapB family tyrosine-protein kinase [Steroidobacteraceae bacterium]